MYQSVHGQQIIVGFVGGLCAGRLYGELRKNLDGLEFRNFTFVQDVLDGRVDADFLVLRSESPPGAREVAFDFAECEASIRSVLGKPWRTSRSALVFRLSGGS